MDAACLDVTIVRDAGAEDVPAITRIYAHSVRTGLASFETDPPDDAEMARRIARIVDAGYPYLVAEEDGRILGYAYASPYRPRPGYRFAVENSIYVAADAQGRGIGRRLLARLIARCEEAGFRQMIAHIGDSDNAASIGLHRAFGFYPVGILPGVGWKFGRWVDSVVLIRPLGAGSKSDPE